MLTWLMTSAVGIAGGRLIKKIRVASDHDVRVWRRSCHQGVQLCQTPPELAFVSALKGQEQKRRLYGRLALWPAVPGYTRLAHLERFRSAAPTVRVTSLVPRFSADSCVSATSSVDAPVQATLVLEMDALFGVEQIWVAVRALQAVRSRYRWPRPVQRHRSRPTQRTGWCRNWTAPRRAAHRPSPIRPRLRAWLPDATGSGPQQSWAGTYTDPEAAVRDSGFRLRQFTAFRALSGSRIADLSITAELACLTAALPAQVRTENPSGDVFAGPALPKAGGPRVSPR